MIGKRGVIRAVNELLFWYIVEYPCAGASDVNGHPCVTLLSLNVDTIAILHSVAMNGRVNLSSHEDCVEIVFISIPCSTATRKMSFGVYYLCFSDDTRGQTMNLKLICHRNTRLEV